MRNWIKYHTFPFHFHTLTLVVKTKIYKELYAAVELAQCVSWLAYTLDECGSVPIIFQENLFLSNPSFWLSRHALNSVCRGGSFCGKRIVRSLS